MGFDSISSQDALLKILSAYSVCSKEWVIRQYDHEVQGGSVVKPLVGITNDGPSEEPPIRILNYSFVDEWRQAVWMADVYYRDSYPAAESMIAAAGTPPAPSRKLATARSLWRHQGCRGIVEHAWRRTRATTETLLSAGAAHIAGQANRWFLNHRLQRH